MTELPAATPYKYQGLPLTPNVIAELAKELLKTPMFRRSELIGAVEQYHSENGGAAAQSLTSATKKALRNLVDAGLLEPTGAYGYWRWITPPHATVEEDGLFRSRRGNRRAGSNRRYDRRGSRVAGSVYVYYFPTYKLLAEFRREERWPVKVGMTLPEVTPKFESVTSRELQCPSNLWWPTSGEAKPLSNSNGVGARGPDFIAVDNWMTLQAVSGSAQAQRKSSPSSIGATRACEDT